MVVVVVDVVDVVVVLVVVVVGGSPLTSVLIDARNDRDEQ